MEKCVFLQKVMVLIYFFYYCFAPFDYSLYLCAVPKHENHESTSRKVYEEDDN